MSPSPQFPADLVTFTEEILNGKIRFLFSVINYATRITPFAKLEFRFFWV